MNRVRGDVPLVIDGRERRLRLTFGALAEIESGLGVSGVGEMAARLKAMGAREMMLVLRALLRGGGEHEAAEKLARCRLELPSAVRAIAQAFQEAAG